MSSAANELISNNAVLKSIAVQNQTLSPKVPSIRQAYLQYSEKQGHPKALSPIGLNEVDKNALYDIYKGETVKYEVTWIRKLRSADKQSYCPLCGAPNPSQLEHYLPRTHYPEYTILSWNLVPTCAVCNPKRGHHAHAPHQSIALIHPYYEAELLKQPLFSVRIVQPFRAVTFHPAPSQGSPQLMERIDRQIRLCFDIEKLNRWLNKLWKEEHAELDGVSTQELAMQKLHRRLQIRIATTGMNSWDTIFYRALLADPEAVQWLRTTPSSI